MYSCPSLPLQLQLQLYLSAGMLNWALHGPPTHECSALHAQHLTSVRCMGMPWYLCCSCPTASRTHCCPLCTVFLCHPPTPGMLTSMLMPGPHTHKYWQCVWMRPCSLPTRSTLSTPYGSTWPLHRQALQAVSVGVDKSETCQL